MGWRGRADVVLAKAEGHVTAGFEEAGGGAVLDLTSGGALRAAPPMLETVTGAAGHILRHITVAWSGRQRTFRGCMLLRVLRKHEIIHRAGP